MAGLMSAGRMNRRVEIMARGTGRDEAGGESEAWNTVATVWAAIDIQQSSLIYETAQFISKVVYRITMRYRPDLALDSSLRLRYTDPRTNGTHTYEIEAVLNTQAANAELILMCYELGGQE